MKRLNDEVLIQLRDDMTTYEMTTELQKMSKSLHRVMEICLVNGMEASSPFLQQLFNGAGCVSACGLMAAQGNQSPILRPQ